MLEKIRSPPQEGRSHLWLQLPRTLACWGVWGCATTLYCHHCARGPFATGLGPIPPPSWQSSRREIGGFGAVHAQECSSPTGRRLCSLERGRDMCGTCASSVPLSPSSPPRGTWLPAPCAPHDGCHKRVGVCPIPPHASGPGSQAVVTHGSDISGTA